MGRRRAELDDVADRLGLDDGMHRVLRLPKRELEVHSRSASMMAEVDASPAGGSITTSTAALDRGVRFTADLTLDLVRANAMWNTWKAAIVEIPYGGAFGGVVVNPKRLSAHEREGLTRRFTTEISRSSARRRTSPCPT